MADISNPDAPATSRQTFFIHRLGGGDVRDQNLTRQQASDMIERLLKQQPGLQEKIEAQKSAKPRKPGQTKAHPFEIIMAEATLAANAAGEQWLDGRQAHYVVKQGNQVVGTLLDVCGIVFIQITDRRTAFAKWVKAKQNGYDTSVRVPHNYTMRQEMGLGEACEGAALRVFREHGIKGLSLYSRID